MEQEGESPHSTFPEETGGDGGENEHQRRRSSSPQSYFSSSPRSRYWQKSSSSSNLIHTRHLAQPVSGKRKRRGTARVFVAWISVIFFLFLLFNIIWFYFDLQDGSRRQYDDDGDSMSTLRNISSSSIGTGKTLLLPQQMPITLKGELLKFQKNAHVPSFMCSRLLALAAHALAEGDSKHEPPDLWKEPKDVASSWTPCADEPTSKTNGKSNGYIIVTANGGINQQRVAICNAVAVTQLLNATLVIPKFQYNNVWRDRSQFGDIYQEEYFINYLKADIQIVKELPLELQSLELAAIGGLVTDSEVMKEAKPSFFLKKILPILLKNRVVHFVGFGNRLASDPIPFDLQRLRCRCNFHALRFVTKIQEASVLLLQRMRKHLLNTGPLEHNLINQFSPQFYSNGKDGHHIKSSRYLAVHLRFEIDMAAYSLCYFGGGQEEEMELEAYREIHFPALVELKKSTKMPSASLLRSEGQCPLTPEEAILMIAALGFKRKTKIYVAGAHVYGGKSRMVALHSLYPNIVTKETLLSSQEIEPFMNHTSQLAALDFIACAAADAFSMTDSGSQFSALVSGYRMYYGGGKLPTIRPNKRRLASIFAKNSTIQWQDFEKRIRKAVRQNKRVIERPIARSIYRHPRCRACMCRIE